MTATDGAPAAAARRDDATLRRLERWLLDEAAPSAPDIGAVVEGLALRLRAEGVPVTRATSHVRTLHPVYRAVMRLWELGQPVREIRPEHGAELTATYLGSTVQFVFEGGGWLERRLSPATDGEFSTLAELRARGFTHYVMAPIAFSTGMVNAFSLATDAPEGFPSTQLDLFRRLVPTLRVVMELKALTRVSAEVLAAYVGQEPMRRILAGTIRRGDTALIDAAILLSDLRGSSALAERFPGEATIALLNSYFDCVVPAVLDEGGEVLKFIGDGVLAIFRVDGEGPGAAARRALAAARAALAELDRAPALPAPEGEPPLRLRMGVALHLGTVAYGNIGSRNRLDFTVVGGDVNFVSRLQGLCGQLGEPLLASASVAAALGPGLERVGDHALKGFAGTHPVWRATAGNG